MSEHRLITRYAIIKRAQKILKEIDSIFDDAEAWGLSAKEADPTGEMLKIRKSLVSMLEREKALGIVPVAFIEKAKPLPPNPAKTRRRQP